MMTDIKKEESLKRIEDSSLEEVAGGINNKEKLMAYIREQKTEGKDVEQILRVVMCQPANLDYLDVTYDENGKPVYATGVCELMEFTREYYDSFIPEPKETTDILP